MKMEKEYLRPAVMDDVERVMAMVRGAQQRLAASGIDQWQNGYPNPERIAEDIRLGVGRVLCVDGRAVAYGALVYTGEVAYDNLRGGKWLTEGTNYATIHRLCVADEAVGRGKGRLFMVLAEAESVSRGVGSIRVDTHPENKIMQSLIASLGYTYCGTVEYESPRLAYEKVVGGN